MYNSVPWELMRLAMKKVDELETCRRLHAADRSRPQPRGARLQGEAIVKVLKNPKADKFYLSLKVFRILFEVILGSF